MINYLQLGRNLRKFSPRVEANSATYIFNSKGIYDFKKMSPKINEELTNSFRGVEKPILELSIKKSKYPIGTIKIKDGEKELSQDIFVLNEGEKIEKYLPNTDGCVKKSIYDKDGIKEIGKQYGLLEKFLTELTSNLKNPKLEIWLKDRLNYSIGNMVLKDGEKVISKGYFSRTKTDKIPIEKFHFTNEKELITGYGQHKDMFAKKYERLSKKLQKRLWILDERAKEIIKRRYGIDCSPKSKTQIAKEFGLSEESIRLIINDSRKELEKANTYVSDLKYDLDNLDFLLSDNERYKIYHFGSSIDINKAETKLIKYNMQIKNK